MTAEPATPAKLEKATFAAGCFWGVESACRALPGVVSAKVGYTGGRTERPTYEDVCTDETGHAEAVEVLFDPARIRYEELLESFWELHDPTTPDRQGPDEGTQYRSAIFVHDDVQRRAAEQSKEMAQRHFADPIVTQIVPAAKFWDAEDYHQRYYEKRGKLIGGCHILPSRARGDIKGPRAPPIRLA